MCENLHYESVYFKELHNQQEYYSVLTDNIQNGGSCSVNEKQEYFYTILFISLIQEYDRPTNIRKRSRR